MTINMFARGGSAFGGKNKFFIIAFFILILIIGVSLGWFFGKGKYKKSADIGQENLPLAGLGEAAKKDEILNKEGFSILVPAGWKEAPAPIGVSALVINISEEITDPALQKINFKSYYSASYDTLGSRSQEEYIEYIKDMLKQTVPEIVFSSEENLTINENDTYILEADLKQQGADFKVLIALVRGRDNDIWNMSFNSGIANWPENSRLFNEIVKSFTVK